MSLETESRQLYCPKCGATSPFESNFCQTCGYQLKIGEGGYRPSGSGSGSSSRGRHNEEGDATGGIIPYKNPAALIAYYLGIFSWIPFFGLLLGLPAFILGIVGLRQRKKNPVIKGSIHAWIGILFGLLTTLLWGGLIALPIIAAIMEGR